MYVILLFMQIICNNRDCNSSQWALLTAPLQPQLHSSYDKNDFPVHHKDWWNDNGTP